MQGVAEKEPGTVMGLQRWQPPEGLSAHNGEPIPADRWFFAPPPTEIGELLSAWSNMSLEKPPKPKHLMYGIPISLIVGAGLGWLGHFEGLVFGVALGVGMFLLVFALCYFVSPWNTPMCTYIGRRGIARYKVKTRGNRPISAPIMEMLLFENAAELRVKMTLINQGLAGATYLHTWTDPGGKKLLSFNGKYYPRCGPVPICDAVHLAFAAEIAWSNFFLDRALQAMEKCGYMQFNIKGEDCVRVAPGFIEIQMRGETMRCGVDEIEKISLKEGSFFIRHKDAKWHSAAGKFWFAYGSIANAKVFLLALEKLMGYTFE